MLSDRQALEAMRFVRTLATDPVRLRADDEAPHEAIRWFVSVEAWTLDALELEALAALYEEERARARLELELEEQRGAMVEATTEDP